MADAVDVLLAAAGAAKERRQAAIDTQGKTTDTMINALQKSKQLGLMDRQVSVEEQTLGLKAEELQIDKMKAEAQSKLLDQFLSQGASGSSNGFQMKGFTSNGMTFEDPNFEARKTQAKKGAADDTQINNFASGMANIIKSMENASPGATDPTSARVSGFMSQMGSAIGASDPKVTAELDTLKLKARSTLKDFESGRLTDADVQDAVNSITGINRNTTERVAKAVSVSRQVAADRGVDPTVVDEKIASSLGITAEQLNQIVDGKIKPKEASKLLREGKKSFKAGDTRVVSGITYERGEDGKWRPKS